MDSFDKIRKSLQKKHKPREPKTKRLNVGKTTKLPVYQWLTHIFRANEEFSTSDKLTDITIVSTMSAEYTKSIALVRSLIHTPSKLASERSRFNKEDSYPLISFAYSDNGFPINRGKAMSLSECRKRCYHYYKIDPRFFSEEELVWIDDQIEEGNEWYMRCTIPSQELRNKFPFGSTLFGIADDNPIEIAMLELEWME
jgi:hypothetical protein